MKLILKICKFTGKPGYLLFLRENELTNRVLMRAAKAKGLYCYSIKNPKKKNTEKKELILKDKLV